MRCLTGLGGKDADDAGADREGAQAHPKREPSPTQEDQQEEPVDVSCGP